MGGIVEGKGKVDAERKKLERVEKTRRRKVEDTVQKKSMETWMNLRKDGKKRRRPIIPQITERTANRVKKMKKN